ncbi:MAG: site-specific DNA-methyltransferase, partial [Lentisphaerae bacterium]|nr:site-specific DNA-methyltransferase [Lentisphaerota bacterium]
LIARMLQIATSPSTNDLVIDFFGGSGSTAHAIYSENVSDGGKRRFILVQLPEPTEQKEYPSIADITKERLRRASRKLRDENPLFTGDLGFRVFKLDSSNIRAWEPNRENLEQTLLDHEAHLKADRTEADILYEVLLKLGLDLCVPIEQRTLAGKTVHSVGGGVLLACLADRIDRTEVEELGRGLAAWRKELSPAGDTTCVFRDDAFAGDVAKTNLAALLQQHGIARVRSL